MTICVKLKEVLANCNDWLLFCKEKGWAEWVVNEGGGDIEVTLSEEDAKRYGLI